MVHQPHGDNGEAFTFGRLTGAWKGEAADFPPLLAEQLDAVGLAIGVDLTQLTSWPFGRRLRDAGLLGSMGTVGDCYDNSMMESFFGTLQLELLNENTWATRDQLATAIFEWIEGWYNPTRRHTSINDRSPAEFETLHHLTATAA